jgi:hypothetical protein
MTARTDGDAEGLGLGLGDGEGEGLGEGDGDGDALGVGLGEGEGVGEDPEPGGFFVFREKSGVGKFVAGTFARAADMKSCQINAGSVPPRTLGNPSTFSIEVFDFRYPIHTQVASCGV